MLVTRVADAAKGWRAGVSVRTGNVLLLLLATAALAACRVYEVGPPIDHAAANKAAEEWRVKHELDYRRDWVSVAGLFPLKPGANTAGSARTNDIVLPASLPPVLGRFTLEGETVRFAPEPGVTVLLRKEPVKGEIAVRDDRSRETDELLIGNVRLVIHVSGRERSIRIRDPDGPIARGFLGFTWFPIDQQYRVVARFIPDAQPRSFKVLNTYGHVDDYMSDGVVEFRLLGQTVRLRPFTTRPKRFYFVFRDASSGQETYETARFLYADLRDDNTTVLDFNIAYNPPCAFNPYTTCPIPLKENHLPLKVLAGEKAYHVPVALPGKDVR
jgi:uncharacterized protein